MNPLQQIAVTDGDVLYEQRLAELVGELADRISRGEQLELESVCREHGLYAADLRDLWGTILLTQAVGSDAPRIPPLAETQRLAQRPLFELPYRMGRFLLREEIGRGGMGIVFRAERIADGQIVAIKLMLKGELATRIDRERFEAEASAAALLNHPRVIPIHEVGEHLGRPWFSMQLIEGQTLAQRLEAGPLPAAEAAALMRDIADAVDYAHRQGILHRDLKPSNILIDGEGNPWVCDFGLAKNAATSAAGKTHLTRTGAVIGTPSYMAPEQAAGARGQVGPVSDVYSLGAVLYHLLTGQPPFQGASPVDTVLMVLEQDPVLPRVLNRKVDRGLERITLRCLQKPQDLRYGSAAALRDDLDAWLENRPVAASFGQLGQFMAGLFRETHHAIVLENWGLLWIWHSLIVMVAAVVTNLMYLRGVTSRPVYELLWGTGFFAWAVVFWSWRRRMGPVTFVERQIAHVWAASLIAIALLFPFENFLGLPLMRLAPALSVVAAMTFLVKAGIFSGGFYFQAGVLLLTAVVMAFVPDYALFLFGAVCGGCFFFPGLKYYRQRLRNSQPDN